ncbi:hypothetical protein BJ122_11741 [Rhodopseudomonas faecalis]|uniref:Uncharacterized protein n=1 Tax=Rhodopseudomonas faecalis TaxID=99655 RepID=A0A318TF61_9BRAD|nr:hypothetical protein BJ122_11741 [Rhodopseudomonas faecalis]
MVAEHEFLGRDPSEQDRDLGDVSSLPKVPAGNLPHDGAAARAVHPDLSEYLTFEQLTASLAPEEVANNGVASFVDTGLMEGLLGLHNPHREAVHEVREGQGTPFGTGLSPCVPDHLLDHSSGSALKPGCDVSQIGRGGVVPEMVTQNANSGIEIGKGDFDVFSQSPRPEDSLVDLVRKVGGTDDNHAFSAVNAIQTFKECVDDLSRILLVLSVEDFPISKGIEFVDEKDAGGVRDRFVEGSPHGFQKVVEVASRLPAGERMDVNWDVASSG